MNSNHFFLVQKCERQLLSGLCQLTNHQNKMLACIACLCLHTSWSRAEESRFTASSDETLDAINDLLACRLALISAIVDVNKTYIDLIYLLQLLKINS